MLGVVSWKKARMGVFGGKAPNNGNCLASLSPSHAKEQPS